ncbi:methylamine dehydrogenase accessory protein MauD [Evansella caseinilytica]|uniref:Methylamine dehydrogenase accessory protein MauD n=1 Tax=Evansella caseinilytica TaxID=1503961 RepID=A0A1H3IW26_9BACI|nr:redoxin domain-containing protein [Evansella caseinilytica]SDY31535.1 methylamine dehydrogenase accessory protein MauD [Evansella caseinilytica]
MEEILLYSVIILWLLIIFHSFLFLLLIRQFGEIFLSSGESILRDGLAIGEKIPDMSVIFFLHQREKLLADVITKPTILCFTAPNCKPCRELIAHWNEGRMKFNDEVNFILVIVGKENEVHKMLGQFPVQGEVIYDKTEELFVRFKVRVTPFAFAVDQSGKVKEKGLCGSKAQLEQYVQSLLTK